MVPVLLDLYATNYKVDDAKFIPPRLSRLLEQDTGPIGVFPRHGPDEAIEAYRRLVMLRYQELVEALGSDDVPIYRGEQLNIATLAKHALKDLSSQKFDEELRHKFEAMTGIDCSSFYKEGKIQPLAAAVLLEEHPAAAKLEPGCRYFFGHRIPD